MDSVRIGNGIERKLTAVEAALSKAGLFTHLLMCINWRLRSARLIKHKLL